MFLVSFRLVSGQMFDVAQMQSILLDMFICLHLALDDDSFYFDIVTFLRSIFGFFKKWNRKNGVVRCVCGQNIVECLQKSTQMSNFHLYAWVSSVMQKGVDKWKTNTIKTTHFDVSINPNKISNMNFICCEVLRLKTNWHFQRRKQQNVQNGWNSSCFSFIFGLNALCVFFSPLVMLKWEQGGD